MRKMSTFVIIGVVVAGALLAFGARAVFAHLEHGAAAPSFTAQAALGGDVETFDLDRALKKGPVVLYFFPASFTSGCTIEAHKFSEAIESYKELGATVIGVSGDDIEKQKKFSTQECRSAFLVASDPGLKIASSYKAKLMGNYANRTSYVIAPDHSIAYSYTSLDPAKHVENTLAALRTLKKTAAK